MPSANIVLLQHLESLCYPLKGLRNDLAFFRRCMLLRIQPLHLPKSYIADSRYAYNILRNLRERLVIIHLELARGYEEYVSMCRKCGSSKGLGKSAVMLHVLNEFRREAALEIENLRARLTDPQYSSALLFYVNEEAIVQFNFLDN